MGLSKDGYESLNWGYNKLAVIVSIVTVLTGLVSKSHDPLSRPRTLTAKVEVPLNLSSPSPQASTFRCRSPSGTPGHSLVELYLEDQDA